MIKSKKVPIQIYLDPDQFKMIDLLSKARNTSKAATIRNCIDKYLASLPLENDPALNLMNLGASGENDISAKHDDYLRIQEALALLKMVAQGQKDYEEGKTIPADQVFKELDEMISKDIAE